MTIAIGDQLPNATFRFLGDDGPAEASTEDLTKGKKIVLFGLPGAFTGTCSTAHLPSFMRTRQAFADKGVDDVICVSVNDVFVMQAWGEQTGATDAGVRLVADPESEFAKAIGLTFTGAPVGLIDRMKRFAMIVEDGKVTELQVEDNPGVCERTAGEALLALL